MSWLSCHHFRAGVFYGDVPGLFRHVSQYRMSQKAPSLVLRLSLLAASARELRLHRDTASGKQDWNPDHFVRRTSRDNSVSLRGHVPHLFARLQLLLNSLVTCSYSFTVQLSVSVFRLRQSILEQAVKGREGLVALPLLKLNDPGVHRTGPSVWAGG